MWKVIQGDEKAGFIKDCQDGKYYDHEVAAIILKEELEAVRVEEISVEEFISDNTVILVKVD